MSQALITPYRPDCRPPALTGQRKGKDHPNIFLLNVSFVPGTTVTSGMSEQSLTERMWQGSAGRGCGLKTGNSPADGSLQGLIRILQRERAR